jgi:uncharacterized protein YndB with AHSA1/START domain
MQHTATTTVSAPVDHVWRVLADHEGMAEWGPGLSVTLKPATGAEPGGVGAVRTISTPLPLPPIVEEITGFEPGARLAYRARSGVPLKEYGGEVVLRPADGDRTRISYTIFATPRVPVIEGLLIRGIATGLLSALARAATR